jgi:hypothetical protein
MLPEEFIYRDTSGVAQEIVIDKDDYTFVFAGCYDQARTFAYIQGIPKHRLHYVSEIRNLMGISGEGRMLFCFGSWERNRDFKRIIEQATISRFKIIFVDDDHLREAYNKKHAIK